MRTQFTTLAATLLTTGLATAQISMTPAATLPTGERPGATAFGDFDLDGDMDLAVTSDNLDKVEIWSNDGTGSFSLTASILTGAGTSADSVVAADLNNDGIVDLAVCLKNVNQVIWILNDASTFTIAQTMSVGAEPTGLAAGDLDNDGDLDLVTANREGNSVSLLVNGGAGAFGAATTTSVGNDLRSVSFADHTGDAMADVAVTSHDSREVFVFNSNGAGLGAPSSIFVGGQVRPDGITATDLNGDGLNDLAVSTSGNGFNQVQAYLSTGAGFGAALISPVGGVDPDAIVAADFDLDGNMDVATADQDSNLVSFLAGTGTGTFAAAVTQATGVRPGGLAVGDFDGDGDADLASANSDSNNVSLFENQAATGGGASNYCSLSPNSAGPGAVIGFTGSLSVAANNFTLTVTGSALSQNGLFYYGANQVSNPFGDGIRCVGAPAFRLNPASQADGSGASSRLVDFTSGVTASGPGAISGGSTWNFQYWFRDPAGGPAGFNFSDGLNVTFQP